MNRVDFREMIAKTMPCSDVSKLEGHLFRLYDTNCDDHIDFVEFMNIFKMLAGGAFKDPFHSSRFICKISRST